MGFEFRCRDIGMECSFEARHADKKGVLQEIEKHAREAHQMERIPDDLRKKIDRAVRKTK